MASQHPYREEHLPEVVPSAGPEFITPADAQRAWGYEERDPKYVVHYDSADTAKKEVLAGAGKSESPISPDAMSPTSPSPNDTEKGAVASGALGATEGSIDEPSEEPMRILGMRKKNFIATVAAVVIVLIALAAGLGAGLSNRSSGDADTNGDAQGVDGGDGNSTDGASSTMGVSETASITTPSSTSSSPTSGSSTNTGTPTSSGAIPTNSVGDQVIGNKDFSFQGWSDFSYSGQRTPEYKDEGFWYFGFNVTSYLWDHGAQRCCVTFCQGEESGGWWCDDRQQPNASGEFDHIQIWCDQDNEKHTEECVQPTGIVRRI